MIGPAWLPLFFAMAGQPAGAPSWDASSASNQFGFELYARIKQPGGNTLCSPVSASIALTMAAARGRTSL